MGRRTAIAYKAESLGKEHMNARLLGYNMFKPTESTLTWIREIR